MTKQTATQLEPEGDPLETVWPRSFGTPLLKTWLGGNADELLDQVLSAQVAAPMWELMDRGGKRWRPVICKSAFDACGGTAAIPESVFNVVELLHNGSLVVDDIQDAATERRGAPPIHAMFGLPVALNAANAAYFRALSALKDVLPDPLRLRALDMLSQELFNAHLGQALDLSLGGVLKAGGVVEVTHYRALASAKTGALVRMAARLGAIAANAPVAMEDALGRWAEGVGLAYQIRDDLEDVDEGLSDIGAGRITLPLLLALQCGDGDLHAAIMRGFGTGVLAPELRADIEAGLARHHIVEQGRQQAHDAAQASIFALNSLPASEPREFLKHLTLKLSGV